MADASSRSVAVLVLLCGAVLGDEALQNVTGTTARVESRPETPLVPLEKVHQCGEQYDNPSPENNYNGFSSWDSHRPTLLDELLISLGGPAGHINDSYYRVDPGDLPPLRTLDGSLDNHFTNFLKTKMITESKHHKSDSLSDNSTFIRVEKTIIYAEPAPSNKVVTLVEGELWWKPAAHCRFLRRAKYNSGTTYGIQFFPDGSVSREHCLWENGEIECAGPYDKMEEMNQCGEQTKYDDNRKLLDSIDVEELLLQYGGPAGQVNDSLYQVAPEGLPVAYGGYGYHEISSLFERPVAGATIISQSNDSLSDNSTFIRVEQKTTWTDSDEVRTSIQGELWWKPDDACGYLRRALIRGVGEGPDDPPVEYFVQKMHCLWNDGEARISCFGPATWGFQSPPSFYSADVQLMATLVGGK